MKEFNAEEVRVETASALETVRRAQAFVRYPAYIGLDVHKETIVVAVARVGRDARKVKKHISLFQEVNPKLSTPAQFLTNKRTERAHSEIRTS